MYTYVHNFFLMSPIGIDLPVYHNKREITGSPCTECLWEVIAIISSYTYVIAIVALGLHLQKVYKRSYSCIHASV